MFTGVRKVLTSARKRRAFRRNLGAADRLLRSAANLRDLAQSRGDEGLVYLCNLSQIATLSSRDLSVVLQDMNQAKTVERRSVYARLIALIVVEWCDDFDHLLGKPLRDRFDQLGIEQATRDAVSSIHSALHDLKTEHGTLLRDIRNVAIAHRDHDAEAQMRLIESLDHKQMEDIAMNIIEWSTEFSDVMTVIMDGYRGALRKSSWADLK